ncbi:hypothetical protein QQ054_14805 [Oscillatoria amoena NRMC-F 0135]|nr:hypothetical protein [Oscillatoria amoena NRMC-F 0135]
MPDPKQTPEGERLNLMRFQLRFCSDPDLTPLPPRPSLLDHLTGNAAEVIRKRQAAITACENKAIEPVARDFSQLRELQEKRIEVLKQRTDDLEQLYQHQGKRADDNLCVIVGLREKVAALGGPPFEMTKEVRALKKLCEVRLQEMEKEANPQKQKSVPEKQQPVPYERPKGILFAKN